MIASELVAFRDSSNIHESLHEVILTQYVPPFPTLHMGHGYLNTALERDRAGEGRGKKGRGKERTKKKKKKKKEEGRGEEGETFRSHKEKQEKQVKEACEQQRINSYIQYVKDPTKFLLCAHLHSGQKEHPERRATGNK